MSITISEQVILDALQQVPKERWREVLQFLHALRITGPAEQQPSPILTGKDLAGSDLIGIWADRTDIGVSREYARRLREQASHRTHQGRSDAP
jgi:hypothetical protein